MHTPWKSTCSPLRRKPLSGSKRACGCRTASRSDRRRAVARDRRDERVTIRRLSWRRPPQARLRDRRLCPTVTLAPAGPWPTPARCWRRRRRVRAARVERYIAVATVTPASSCASLSIVTCADDGRGVGRDVRRRHVRAPLADVHGRRLHQPHVAVDAAARIPARRSSGLSSRIATTLRSPGCTYGVRSTRHDAYPYGQPPANSPLTQTAA